MAPAKTHIVAALLALLTTIPYPGIRSGPKDTLESPSWLSYNLLDGVVTQVPKSYGATANGIGAGLVIAYLIRTAWLSFRLSLRLALNGQKVPDANYPAKASIMSCISFLVFVTLALNMLLYGTNEYLTWANSPLRTKVEDSFPLRVWQWLLASQPFLDFTRALFVTNGGYWWSAQSMLSAMATNFWMSAAAQIHDIPNTLDYFILAQLFPPSFAQTLFFVAILLQKFSKEPASTTPRSTRMFSEMTGWGFLVCFRLLIAYLPLALSPSPRLIMGMALTRLLLFSNYFILFDSPATIEAAFPWVMIYRLPLLGAKFFTSPSDISSAMTSNFAVSTLSIDLIFSIMNTALFYGWDVAYKWMDEWAIRKVEKRRQQRQQQQLQR